MRYYCKVSIGLICVKYLTFQIFLCVGLLLYGIVIYKFRDIYHFPTLRWPEGR